MYGQNSLFPTQPFRLQRTFSVQQVAAASHIGDSSTARYTSSEYHVLFLLLRNVRIGTANFCISAGSTEEKAFYQAVANFKYSIQMFTHHKVFCKVVEITERIETINSHTIHMTDIANHMQSVYTETFDAVIAASKCLHLSSAATAHQESLHLLDFYGYTPTIQMRRCSTAIAAALTCISEIHCGNILPNCFRTLHRCHDYIC